MSVKSSICAPSIATIRSPVCKPAACAAEFLENSPITGGDEGIPKAIANPAKIRIAVTRLAIGPARMMITRCHSAAAASVPGDGGLPEVFALGLLDGSASPANMT